MKDLWLVEGDGSAICCVIHGCLVIALKHCFYASGKCPKVGDFFLLPKGQSQSMSQMPLGFWGKDDIVANLILRLQMAPRADSNCP